MVQSPIIKKFLDFTRKILFKIFKSEKMRTIITKFTEYEVFTYLVFGVLTTLVDMVIYYSLVYMGADEVITNVISSTCAIFASYASSRSPSFKVMFFTNFTSSVLEPSRSSKSICAATLFS